MSGAFNQDMHDFVETWESVTPITNFIITRDHRGENKPVGIQGERTFKLTTFERMITQDAIHDPKHDPFTNGSFRPVVVPADVNIETNPNALSDADIDRIFTASELAWAEYMKVVDSPSTLRRMLDRAEDADISLKRYRELEAKLDATDSGRVKRVTSTDTLVQKELDSAATSTPSPNTPARGRPRKTS